MKHSTSNICEEDGAVDAGRRAAREGGIPSGGPRPQPDPPMLIGGSFTTKRLSESLRAVTLDFLTVTVSTAEARDLLGRTTLIDAGNARPGFKSSERRICQGGECWRRWNPHQPSKAHGHAYESWEFDGTTAHAMAPAVAALESAKASRVDVAFDLHASITPDDLVESLSPDVFKRRDDGIVGKNGVNTRYIGASTSERSIRIYRKDLRDAGWPPTLRIEPIFKGDYAAWLWQWFRVSFECGFEQASGHLRQLTGIELAGVSCVPSSPVPSPAKRPAARLAALLRQYAGVMHAAAQAGIDMQSLAAEFAQQATPQARGRAARLRDEICQAGAAEVVDEMSCLLFDSMGNIK